MRGKTCAVPMAVSKWWQDFAIMQENAVQELANMVIEVCPCVRPLINKHEIEEVLPYCEEIGEVTENSSGSTSPISGSVA